VAQLATVDGRRPARPCGAGRLLNLHLHQLAPHPSLPPRLAHNYQDHGLVVLGVHTPEFDFEHDLDNVCRAAKGGHPFEVLADADITPEEEQAAEEDDDEPAPAPSLGIHLERDDRTR
jgi:hypothetical protein